MNRNTLVAFGLILVAIVLFTSKPYYRFVNKAFHTNLPVEPSPSPATVAPAVPENKPPAAGKDEALTKAIPGARNGPASAATARADTLGSGAASDTAGPHDTAWVETDKMICGISLRGARIVSLKTKEFRYRDGGYTGLDSGLIELLPRDKDGGASLSINGERLDGRAFAVEGEGRRVAVKGEDSVTLSFVSKAGSGVDVRKGFTFFGNQYRIGYLVESPSLAGKSIEVGWRAGIGESERLAQGSSGGYDQRTAHVYDANERKVEHFQQKKPQRDVLTGSYRWVGVTSKYFLIALVSDSARDAELSIDGFETAADSVVAALAQKKKGPTNLDYSIAMKRYVEGARDRYWIYAGPSKLGMLKEYHVGLESVLFGSPQGSFSNGFAKVLLRADIWFPYVCEFILWLLIVLQKGVKDYGLVIILLTVFSKLVTFPMTQSSMKSMSRMKDIQPKINAIRLRYKANPKKMNEEVMALYKTEGVNPLNPGCLPLILQTPVFIALFVVLRKAIELRGAATVLVPWIKDLSQPEALPVVTPLLLKVFPAGLPMYGSTIGLLPIVMAILTFFQNKMTIKDPNQKAMIYFMPVFLLVLFNSFPAGLVLYWTVQNVLGIVQQYYINKSSSVAAVAAVVPGPNKKSKTRAGSR